MRSITRITKLSDAKEHQQPIEISVEVLDHEPQLRLVMPAYAVSGEDSVRQALRDLAEMADSLIASLQQRNHEYVQDLSSSPTIGADLLYRLIAQVPNDNRWHNVQWSGTRDAPQCYLDGNPVRDFPPPDLTEQNVELSWWPNGNGAKVRWTDLSAIDLKAAASKLGQRRGRSGD